MDASATETTQKPSRCHLEMLWLVVALVALADEDDGSSKVNSQADKKCAPAKKVYANTGCCRIFHIAGTPRQIVRSLRGRSDQMEVVVADVDDEDDCSEDVGGIVVSTCNAMKCVSWFAGVPTFWGGISPQNKEGEIELEGTLINEEQ